MKILSVLIALALCVPCFGQLDTEVPVLGLYYIPVADSIDTFKSMGMPSKLMPKAGLLVLDVIPSAARQGARPLDLIQSIDGRRVTNAEQMQQALDGKQPGDTVAVQFRRFAGGWRAAKGELHVTDLRSAAYDSLDVTSSSVNDATRAEHVSLTGQISTLSPVIVLSSGEPSLFLKVRWCSDDWLFIERVTLKAGTDTAQLALTPRERLEADAQLLSGTAGKVMETVTVPMPADIASVIRTPIGTTINCRVDGKSTYVESELDRQWHVRAKAVVDAYDDLVATKDFDALTSRAK